jgi:hypothetical protein
MTDDLRVTLRQHRAEIVALLKGDPAAIVAEWRALGAEIRLDQITALDPEGDDAPQWLHQGKGWCCLPEGLRRRIQDNQAVIVRHLRVGAAEPHDPLRGRGPAIGRHEIVRQVPARLSSSSHYGNEL